MSKGDAEQIREWSREKPLLVATAGLPRSGKSTWARSLGHPIVSPDAVRLAVHGQSWRPTAEPLVWGLVATMIEALFHGGHYVVVLDACNGVPHRRAQWRHPERLLAFKWFEVDAEECARRAVAEGRPWLEEIIRHKATYYSAPTVEEGYLL